MDQQIVDPRRWDLSDVYADDEAWERARRQLAERLDELSRYRGRLEDGPEVLHQALELSFQLHEQVECLHTYASLRADEDLREATPRAMKQSIEAFFADMASASSWVDPEILALPPDTVARYLREHEPLAKYRRYLEKLERRREHTLDRDSERLLGMVQLIRGDGATVAGLLQNADIRWPTVELSDDTSLRLDAAGYAKGRSRPERGDRETVFSAFFGELSQFKGSLAATLYQSVKEHVFEARVRRYPSSLDAALHVTEVDPSVYRMLIQEVNGSLPALHRYLRLRSRILGISDLRYHDLYAPLTAEVADTYTWDRAREFVLDALRPLGEVYVDRLRHALTGRWADVDPRRGKRAGAYVNDGAYAAHPYMLLNHIDDFQSTSTIAHESGHLMHSWLSQESQPYPTARYVIFVAEVASTLNEQLLFHFMHDAAKSDVERLSLLGHYLETLRGTVFRQSMFAEFELAIHEAVERGEALTGEALDERYLELQRRYHGHAEGVMQVDEEFGVEWAYVPHFHYNFYVYQYATSFVAAVALSRRILDGEEGALDRYLAFLGAGSTTPPVDLLRRAGVDMTSPEPFRAAIREMHRVMDEIESILERDPRVVSAGDRCSP
ncbi:MAG: oligoendopeptidase F [Acidobacteriota bacterium]|nr:oligoendopeptidase F [Acidobacteriota bacterium]